MLGLAILIGVASGAFAQTSTKLPEMTFTLEPPAGWEVQVQVTLLEPAPFPLPNPPPRANVVIRRTAAMSSTPRAACEQFLQEARSSIPEIQAEEIVPFMFQDRGAGVAVQVSFPAKPNLRLVQLHAFRIDDKIQTQLVATVGEFEKPERRKAVQDLLRKFRP
jgi:hypothetical protein